MCVGGFCLSLCIVICMDVLVRVLLLIAIFIKGFCLRKNHPGSSVEEKESWRGKEFSLEVECLTQWIVCLIMSSCQNVLADIPVSLSLHILMEKGAWDSSWHGCYTARSNHSQWAPKHLEGTGTKDLTRCAFVSTNLRNSQEIWNKKKSKRGV